MRGPAEHLPVDEPIDRALDLVAQASFERADAAHREAAPEDRAELQDAP